MPALQLNSSTIGQKDGKKWTAAAEFRFDAESPTGCSLELPLFLAAYGTKPDLSNLPVTFLVIAALVGGG
ncbi:MAG: hypothetical protein ACYCZ6_12865 [Polaromonas sp.]